MNSLRIDELIVAATKPDPVSLMRVAAATAVACLLFAFGRMWWMTLFMVLFQALLAFIIYRETQNLWFGLVITVGPPLVGFALSFLRDWWD